MTLQGKGFFTYSLPECEGGEPGTILATAQAAGLSHVIIKIADGVEDFGVDASGIDYTAPVVQVLHAARIAVWGWHTVHGHDPSAEATIAIARTQALRLDGYVVEAKGEYDRSGMSGAARQFMSAVRRELAIPIALSSYRFPNYHPQLPWSTFLEFCDLHMPQVSWEQAHNAGDQLCESLRQCDALPNARPCIPTGAVFATSGWSPTAEELNDFLNTAKAIGLPAVNFFNWETCRRNLPHLWTTIADFAWPAEAPHSNESIVRIASPDIFQAQFLAALNSHQAAQASILYDPAATQVRADHTLTGAAAIQTGYLAFFGSLPAETIFTISQSQVEDDSLMFSWKAGPLSGETTLVLESGKIILDYTYIWTG
jgi:hypothetical protein